jgi:hypothetical protein
LPTFFSFVRPLRSFSRMRLRCFFDNYWVLLPYWEMFSLPSYELESSFVWLNVMRISSIDVVSSSIFLFFYFF